jgi:DNA-binding NarL/FixJ family response regulator
MKASSTTSCDAMRDGPLRMERTRPTVVAIGTRDEVLAAALTARLVRSGHAVALTCLVADSARLLSWLDDCRADVLLLDERWLHRLDPRAAQDLRGRCPELRVLVLCERASAALAEEIVRSRFRGFLLASGAADACAKAIRVVEQGELWIPRSVLVDLVLDRAAAAGYQRGETDPEARLTRREAEVIGYLRRGMANKQIADALAIREDTVKKHLRNAYAKLGVHRRSHIIVHGAAQRPAGTRAVPER